MMMKFSFFPALIKKINQMEITGSNQLKNLGKWKTKKVMHVDDLADACVFMKKKQTNR